MSVNPQEAAVCRACGTALSSRTAEALCPKCLLECALRSNEFSDPNTTLPLDSSIPSSPFTGTRLPYFGDYELLEEIARGGMGLVFKARQLSLNRVVALKLISAGALATEDLVKRFKAEAEAAASLSHPNIVPIHEIGEHQGQHYFSMGLVDGPNLDEYLSQGRNRRQQALHRDTGSRESGGRKSEPPHVGACAIKEAARLVLTLARAVHHAHQHGVLHRDIKPSNVLIDKEGAPHLTDFGLAKLAQKDSTLTHTNAIMGTPSYMAPEQARGETKNVTTAADIYGLGAVLYTCLTGHPPFAGGTSFETIRQVLEEDARPPSEWNREVDGDLQTICLKCLAKDATQRYSSAEAFAVDLEHWLKSEPIVARPVTSFGRLQKWVRRRPAIAALSALSILLVLALGIGATLYSLQLRQASAKLEEHLYASEIGVAFAAWDLGKFTQPREIIDKYRPKRGERDLRGFEWHYLDALCRPRELFSFPKQASGLFGLACSPDGRIVAAGQMNNAIRLIDLVSHRELPSLTSSEAGVAAYSVAFDPKGKRLLASSSGSPFVTVWDLERNSPITNLAHSYFTTAVAFSPDGRLIVSSAFNGLYNRKDPGELVLWSGTTYEKLFTFPEERSGAWETVFSPDGQLLATAHCDGSIILWHVETRQALRTVQAHADIVSALAFSPDGRWLASGSMDQNVSLWTLPDFRQVPLGWHDRIDSVVFSSDGEWLASSARDGTIKLWNTAARTEKPMVLRGHTSRVWSIAFTPDSQRLVSGSVDGTIKIWDWKGLTHQGQRPVETKLGLTFSADGRLNLDEVNGQTVIRSVPSEAAITNLPITSAAFSPDGRSIAGLAEGRLEIYDQETFRKVGQVFSDHPLSSPVQFAPNGEWLLVRRSPQAVELRHARREWNIEALWELPERERLGVTYAGLGLYGFAFSPDSRYLAATQSGGRVALFDLRQRRTIHELRRSDLDPNRMAWIPGSHQLVIGSMDEFVHVWDVDTGIVRILKPAAGNSWAVAVSPDGKTLAVGTQDGFIKLINVRTLRDMATLRGHLTNITGMSFSPDGTMLISTGGEGSRLWNARELAADN